MAGKTFRLPPLPPKFTPVAPQVDFQSGGTGAEVFYSMEGMRALIENIGQMPEVAKDAAGYEMANIGEEIIVDAQTNYVPVDIGTLRDSGKSDEYKPGRGQEIVEIGVWFAGDPDGVSSGGESISGGTAIQLGLHEEKDPRLYAAEQHEVLTLNHPHGGGPKYLERPFMAKKPEILPRLTKAVNIALGTDGGNT